MATARYHLDRAERILARAETKAAGPDATYYTQLSQAHAAIGRLIVDIDRLERMAAFDDFAEREIRDLTLPDNDEGAADAPATPSV